MQEKKTIKILYSITLFLLTVIIWDEIYEAQFLAYDENWGNLITAFLISFCSIFVLIFIWSNWQKIILACKWQTLLFLLLASPITVVYVVFNYKSFFGVVLRV
jgi:hypothetical protein